MGLHYGGVAIDVDNQACQAVALGMDEAEAVGVRIVGQAHDFADFVGMVELIEEKPLIDSAILETEHFHGNALRLAKAGAEDFAIIIGHSDRVASLQAFGGIVNGTRKHPRVETA